MPFMHSGGGRGEQVGSSPFLPMLGQDERLSVRHTAAEFVCIVGVSMCVSMSFNVTVPWGLFVLLEISSCNTKSGVDTFLFPFFFFACYCFVAGDKFLQAKG